MRLQTSLLALLLSFASLQAQGFEQMIPNAGSSGVEVVEDNDPFVPNTFIGSFRMEVHNFKNGKETKESPMDMHYWSSADKTLVGITPKDGKGKNVKMMTDLKGKWTYLLMDVPGGNSMAMKMHKKKYILKDSPDKKDKDKDMDFKVTKETKTIDGHLCKKVTGHNDEGTWTAWVAEDIPMVFADLARSIGQSGQPGQLRDWDGLKGFPLEMTSESTDGKEKTVIYMKDLQAGTVDQGVFSLDGYKVMSMPTPGN